MTRFKKSSSKNPNWKLFVDQRVIRNDLSRLDSAELSRFWITVESKLLINPSYFGERLRGVLINHWKLRFGDWRIVYNFQGKVINIWAVVHRSEIYPLAVKRLIK